MTASDGLALYCGLGALLLFGCGFLAIGYSWEYRTDPDESSRRKAIWSARLALASPLWPLMIVAVVVLAVVTLVSIAFGQYPAAPPEQ